MLAEDDKDGVMQGTVGNQHVDALLGDWLQRLQQGPATVWSLGHPRCGDISVRRGVRTG